jgi:hypothetical protein
MWTLLRRFLVVAALMFWLGGFTFYAAVVVPIGTAVLGTSRDQGFITRRVTVYLNLAGAVALVPLAGDVAAGRDPSAWRRRARWGIWLGMLLTLALLAWLHPRLDALLDAQGMEILDRRAFRAGHRLYLWTHTVQWGLGVLYIVSTLAAWRKEDFAAVKEGGKKEEGVREVGAQ